MKVVAIDFETANEHRNSACSIGIAIADNDRNITCHHFYIKPVPCEFASRQVKIHGITPDDVADAPTLPELWPQIWPLLDGALVIAHNAPFDMSVLRHSLNNSGGYFSFKYTDTCTMAREFLPRLINHKLNTLCDYFDIKLDHHRADSDAAAALELFFKLLDKVECKSPESFVHFCHNLVRVYDSTDSDSRKSLDPYQSYHRDAEANWIEIPKYKPAYPLPGIAGKSICVTGNCLTFDRQRLLEYIALTGGIPCESVSYQTDILIVGNIPAKTKRANLKIAEDLQAAGHRIQIINEDDFWKMIPTGDEKFLSYHDRSIRWDDSPTESHCPPTHSSSYSNKGVSVTRINAIDTVYEDNNFLNKSFCLTGELSIPRKEAMEIISKLGGCVTTTITRKTNYLLIGSDVDYNGRKMKKALAAIESGQKIRIIDEEKFLQMIDIEAYEKIGLGGDE